MNQPIINNEVKKEESIRPSGSTEYPKPAETPKKGFFSFFGNPFSNNETEEQCIQKCRNKHQPKTVGGKKHRSKKNKNSIFWI
ncbi:MAG: hypothetical protein EBR69_05455 [Synechococcaceae bacterium WB4_2_0805]|nr:hypothetical protein [Synechococcaceae bacterium WB4_2_0805]